jgi:hypothetical protein
VPLFLKEKLCFCCSGTMILAGTMILVGTVILVGAMQDTGD